MGQVGLREAFERMRRFMHEHCADYETWTCGVSVHPLSNSDSHYRKMVSYECLNQDSANAVCDALVALGCSVDSKHDRSSARHVYVYLADPNPPTV